MSCSEINEKNILAVKAHVDYVLGLVRSQDKIVEEQAKRINQLELLTSNLSKQIVCIQVKVFSGGATSDDIS